MKKKEISLVLGSGGARGLAHIGVIHWLKQGSLFDAIRASISLPLFFKPFDMNGMKLLDGGILNPVPIAPTFEDNTDLTIAINLGASVPQGWLNARKAMGMTGFLLVMLHALMSFLLGAAHLFFMGYEGWLSPASWHGGLPPISLVAFAFFAVGFVINLFGRE